MRTKGRSRSKNVFDPCNFLSRSSNHFMHLTGALEGGSPAPAGGLLHLLAPPAELAPPAGSRGYCGIGKRGVGGCGRRGEGRTGCERVGGRGRPHWLVASGWEGGWTPTRPKKNTQTRTICPGHPVWIFGACATYPKDGGWPRMGCEGRTWGGFSPEGATGARRQDLDGQDVFGCTHTYRWEWRG